MLRRISTIGAGGDHRSRTGGRRKLPKKKALPPDQETVELLRSILILQLKQLGLASGKIRKIVGCAMSRVNSVLTKLPKEKKKKQ
jgi:hypothetical protein